jgi:hypothetical protein
MCFHSTLYPILYFPAFNQMYAYSLKASETLSSGRPDTELENFTNCSQQELTIISVHIQQGYRKLVDRGN